MASSLSNDDTIVALVAAVGSVSAAEMAVLDGVTPGTATASKAVVLDGSKGISTITSATITTLTSTTVGATTGNITTVAATDVNTTNVTLGAGGKIDLDSATATLSSNAATITKWAAQITSEALTTAAGASQAFVITLTGVAATDLAFVTPAGGTNTREHIQYKAICTSNTVTVTMSNIGPADAVNGTVIFNLLVMKA